MCKGENDGRRMHTVKMHTFQSTCTLLHIHACTLPNLQEVNKGEGETGEGEYTQRIY